MTRKLIEKIGRSRRQLLLRELKLSDGGLPVAELARRLGLSYMGAKDICKGLHRDGYLTTWRSPVARGRPELLYRLTPKASELFEQPDFFILPGLLDASRKLFGETAPAKLLFLYFQEKAEAGKGRVRGESLPERLGWLARWRDAEGHFSRVEPGPPPFLVENHQPLREVFSIVPEARNMETKMLSAILGTELHREEKSLDGHVQSRFIPVA